MTKTYNLSARIWLYPGKAAWHFVSIPTEIAKDIDYLFAHAKKGWGSLPAKVTIGQTTWTTSIFQQKKTASYLLPLKAEIRKKEHLHENDLITFSIELKD